MRPRLAKKPLEAEQAGTDGQEPSPCAFAEILPISDREFRLFQQYIEANTGIFISDAKRGLLARRLNGRLRELGLESFWAYFQRVCEPESEESRIMIDQICINVTRFFREPLHFEFLENELIPWWKRRAIQGLRSPRIRVWSAGCSTGEEPFSLAMTLLENLPPSEGWQIQICATDLSRTVLRRAENAIWPRDQTDEIPDRYMKRYMRRSVGTRSGELKAGPELRALIEFSRANLNAKAISEPFDLILCRNVLIYFSPEARARAIDRLIDQLAPDGVLCLGHAETLNRQGNRVRRLQPTIYAKKDELNRDPSKGPGL